MPDGTLTFCTELDNSKLTREAKGLKKVLDRLTQSIRGEKMGSKAFEAARQKARETEIAIQAVQRQMEEAARAAPSYESAAVRAFERARQKVEENRAAMGELDRQMGRIAAQKKGDLGEFYQDPGRLDEAVAGALEADKAYQKLGAQYDRLILKHQQLTSQMEAAQQAAIQGAGANSKEYQKLESQLDSLNVKLAQYKSRMESAAAASANAEKETRDTGGGMKEMIQQTVPLTKSLFKVSSMLKLVALRMAIRNIVNAAVKGFQDLAKASSPFNRAMSQLSTQLLQLRNAITSAFAPVLTALVPVITAVTNALTGAFHMMAAFTARLFGNAKAYTKASKAAINYAQDTGRASSSLAAFDDLDVLQKDEGTGGAAPSDMFEEVAIPDEAISLADKLKAKFQEMMKPLKEIDFSNLLASLKRLRAEPSGAVWSGPITIFWFLWLPGPSKMRCRPFLIC